MELQGGPRPPGGGVAVAPTLTNDSKLNTCYLLVNRLCGQCIRVAKSMIFKLGSICIVIFIKFLNFPELHFLRRMLCTLSDCVLGRITWTV